MKLILPDRAGISVILLLIFFSIAPLQADTIILHNGQSYTGDVVTQTRYTITLATSKGPKIIQKKQIKEIKFTRKKPGNAHNNRVPQKHNQQLVLLSKKERQKEAEKRKAERRRRLNKLPESIREGVGEIRSIRKADVLLERNEALWRSAILPGWGHYYLDDYYKSVLLLSLTAFSYSFFTNNYIEFKAAERAYNDSSTPILFTAAFGANGLPITLYYFDVLRKKALQAESNLNLISWVAGALWAYSIIDVWYNHDRDFKLSLILAPPGRYNGLAVGKIDTGLSLGFRWYY